jgi:CubicO group peptidase (beta-lactamase class C family)
MTTVRPTSSRAGRVGVPRLAAFARAAAVHAPRAALGLFAALVLAVPGPVTAAARAKAPAIAPAEIDRVVTRVMAAYPVPGIAVGVVKDGTLVYAKGFGVRSSGAPERVDADTLFAVGSNTKAFTTAALAILVDEGKLRWDDRVIDLLPDFRMQDAWVTREFTVRDLLTHRSGLPPGAGDLMFAPKTDFTRAEIVRALRHLKPVASFRSEYAYDNLLYAVAGEVVAVVSGQSWEQFVESRILKPLGMDGCAAASSRATGTNVASPHVLLDGTLRTVPVLEIAAVNPAGSLVCSVNGLSRWVATQLADGAIPGGAGARLFSAARSAEMHTPQTIIRANGRRQTLTRTHFTAYGLGWVLEDYQGYRRVSHNGGLPGMVTHVGMIPELGLGVIVLTNQQEPGALPSIALQILDAYAGSPKRDWLALTQEDMKARAARLVEASAKRAPPRATQPVDPATFAAFVGRYTDAWRGDATVTRDGEGLVLTFSRTDGLVGPMEPVAPGLFIARWKDRTIDADAYVRFTEDIAGKVTGFTMKPVSDLTDFSYDFADLDFKRQP